MTAFAHLIPPAEPTLAQLAIRLRTAIRDFNRVAAGQIPAAWETVEREEMEAASAFFERLEAETGISRELLREIGAVA